MCTLPKLKSDAKRDWGPAPSPETTPAKAVPECQLPRGLGTQATTTHSNLFLPLAKGQDATSRDSLR